MIGFGISVGGNLLASLTWHFIEPFIANKQATREVTKVVREVFDAEVRSLCDEADADPTHVLQVLDHTLPPNVASLVARYAGVFDTNSLADSTGDDLVERLTERLVAAGLDVTTLEIDIRSLLKAVPGAARRALRERATRPSSPIYNRVSLDELEGIREELSKLRKQLDLPVRETDAIPIPVPPDPYFPYRFALQANVGWRQAERKHLTEWWLADEPSVLVMVAFGGMGKSSLAWTWLLHDVLGSAGSQRERKSVAATQHRSPALRPHGAFWWSFYEPDGFFARFLDEALAYTEEEGSKRPTPLTDNQKLSALLTNLQAHRFLLVLDGFERELARILR